MKQLLFLVLIFLAGAGITTAQPTQPGEFTENEMATRAKARARTLENAIERVIAYGKDGKTPKTFIDEVLLPDFIPDATIETASISRSGMVVVNPPISYKRYFNNLWRKARTTPSLKVYFSDVDVKKIDRYRYRVTIRIEQEYESQRYSDTTTKDIDIHFIPQDGAFTEKIGSTKVVDIKRK